MIGYIAFYYKDPCSPNDGLSIILDISGVNNKSQNIITEVAKDINIIASATCTNNVVYSLDITPTPATANLFTLTTTTTPQKITFAASSNIGDAKMY